MHISEYIQYYIFNSKYLKNLAHLPMLIVACLLITSRDNAVNLLASCTKSKEKELEYFSM